MEMSRVPILVILGSTGSGKSKLGIELARRFCGEIISADSMQLTTNVKRLCRLVLRFYVLRMLDFFNVLYFSFLLVSSFAQPRGSSSLVIRSSFKRCFLWNKWLLRLNVRLIFGFPKRFLMRSRKVLNIIFINITLSSNISSRYNRRVVKCGSCMMGLPFILVTLPWDYLDQRYFGRWIDLLRDRILYGCHRIWNTVEILVRQNMRRRIDAEGGHFQHLLRSTDMTSEGYEYNTDMKPFGIWFSVQACKNTGTFRRWAMIEEVIIRQYHHKNN
ncbi:tRNA dimethylallyltransferase isoform X1 [Vespula squamosa]|uniref:tRNA dimethylallyltransferase isoform X1 n=1 Tax=Vespula squamosa TaxID=30214 RepID=A0ABD2ADF2_VESSQ